MCGASGIKNEKASLFVAPHIEGGDLGEALSPW